MGSTNCSQSSGVGMRQQVWRCLAAAVLVCVICGVATQSVAQEVEYKAWQRDDTLAAQEQAIMTNLRGGTITDRQQLDRFFTLYYFPRWTDPTNAPNLTRFANELFGRDVFGGISGTARTYLLSASFDQLSKMAEDGTVHPPARINAMLTIGKLVELPAANTGEADKPYASALPHLMKEYERATNPEWLRLAALLGIVRHCFLGVADDTIRKETLPTLLRSILSQQKPTADDTAESRELKDWFRLRAIEGIQGLRTTGEKSETVESLLAIMEDTNESFDIRYAATRVLGDLPLKASKDAGIEINPDRITAALFLVTKNLCKDEIAFIDSLYTKSAVGSGRGASSMGGMGGSSSMMGGGMGGMGGGMMGGGSSSSSSMGIGSGTSTPHDVEQSVARLKQAICSILNGFGGSRLSKISPYSDSVGATPLIAANDPIQSRIANTTKLLNQFLVFLDDGPKDMAGMIRPGGGTGSSSSSMPGGGSSSSGTRPGGAAGATGPTFNVTLADIRYELLSLAKLLSDAAMTR